MPEIKASSLKGPPGASDGLTAHHEGKDGGRESDGKKERRREGKAIMMKWLERE